MIKWETTYPGRAAAPSAEYPEGAPRNIQAATPGTGTPFDEQWALDMAGAMQSVLAAGGVAASGAPDEVGTSDFLDGLNGWLTDQRVQQTADDTTAGKLLKVGSFGLGGLAVPTANLNNSTENMLRSWAGAVANAPYNDGTVLDIFHNANSAAQLIMGWADDRISYRRRNGGAWLPPVEMWHEGNLELQTSATDATANRVMLTGAAGVCDDTSSPLTNDLDTIPISGMSHADSSGVNVPTGSTIHAVIRANARNAGEYALLDFDVLRQAAYIRTKGPGSPDSWQELYTTANFQPQDQNGLNTVRILRNDGADIASGGIVAGSQLQFVCWDTAGGASGVGSPSGSWKNIANFTINSSTTRVSYMVKVSI